MFINTIFDNTYAWLSSKWTGNATAEDLKSAYEQVFQLMKADGSDVLIIDCRKIACPAGAAEFDEWLRREWLPQAEAGGLSALIHLVPKLEPDQSGTGWPFLAEERYNCCCAEDMNQAVRWLRFHRNKNKDAA
jgi:hypothetical protein